MRADPRGNPDAAGRKAFSRWAPAGTVAAVTVFVIISCALPPGENKKDAKPLMGGAIVTAHFYGIEMELFAPARV